MSGENDCLAIVPAAKRADINLVCSQVKDQYGNSIGPDVFSVGLGPTSSGPITHYGFLLTEISDALAVIFTNMPKSGGTVPQPEVSGSWGTGEGEAGITEALAKAACAAVSPLLSTGSECRGLALRDAALRSCAPPLKVVEETL